MHPANSSADTTVSDAPPIDQQGHCHFKRTSDKPLLTSPEFVRQRTGPPFPPAPHAPPPCPSSIFSREPMWQNHSLALQCRPYHHYEIKVLTFWAVSLTCEHLARNIWWLALCCEAMIACSRRPQVSSRLHLTGHALPSSP